MDDTILPAGPGIVEPGGENATVRAAVVTGTLLALAALLVLYVLIQVWPPAPPPHSRVPPHPPPPRQPPTPPTTTVPAGEAATATTVVVRAAPNPPIRLFAARLEVRREARLFIVVALAGALGGLVGAVALRRDVTRWSVTSTCDQIAKINSSNATATRRLVGSSTASS